MQEKKQSRREEYTINAIREAFMPLMLTRGVERISVGEVCKLADINRSTFYRHYLDIYDLLDEVVGEVFEEIFTAFAAELKPSNAPDDMEYHYILQACELTEKNKELYCVLLFQQPAAKLQQRLTDALFDLYFNVHNDTFPDTPKKALHYRYLVSGIMGIWTDWIRSGCDQPKEVIAETVKDHLRGFFFLMGYLYQGKRY